MKYNVFTNTIKKIKTMSKKSILLAATLFIGFASFANDNSVKEPESTVTTTEATTTDGTDEEY